MTVKHGGEERYFESSSEEFARRLQYTAVGVQNVSRMAVPP
ncbi:MAG: hypothetical protein OEW88_00135 [Gammaproteobacteria bacterium]|nr:hypothetical protein [Gammaproteobacteria bacterium]MDH5274813.1 hypothetical protein [Gammaproteobacteria bacterium]